MKTIQLGKVGPTVAAPGGHGGQLMKAFFPKALLLSKAFVFTTQLS